MPDVLAGLLDAIDLAVVAADRDGNVTYWSRGAAALYGWTAEDCLGRSIVDVAPALDAGAARQLLAEVEAGNRGQGVFAVRRKDGSQFDARVTLSGMRDAAGDLVGVVAVSEDVTQLHEHEREFAERTERLELALASGRMGTWRWDVASGGISWDETLERLFGLPAGSYDRTFEQYAALIHPDDREAVLSAISAALISGSEYEVEHRLVAPDGSVRWIGGAGRVVPGPLGEPVAMIGVAADITGRKEAEAERAALLTAERSAHASAAAAGARLAFLAAAGELLAETLDYDETLERVADLVVSRLADWCTIDLVDIESGWIRRAVVAHSAHVDPAIARALARVEPVDPDAPGGVPQVIRTRTAALYPEVTDEVLQDRARNPEHLELLRTMDVRTMVVVPLVARGRTTGALGIMSSSSGRRYDADDLTLAMELARRAAIAIDNARVFAERAAVAAALQRSLLPPELPEVAGLEIAARYRPAQRGLDIGGDFYDVFRVANDSWCFVIGDVCGKGADAAALTGAVRWTIRAVATRELDPRRIIHILNETLLAEQSHNRFCTVIVAIATVGEGIVRLSVANGGHPPPLVRRAVGGVERGSEGGMLVGTLSDIDVALDEFSLGPGDAVVLYTDGVTETRSGSDMFGEDRLLELVEILDTWSASATAEAIERAVSNYQTGPVRDDLAVVVIRAPAPGDVIMSSTQEVAISRS